MQKYFYKMIESTKTTKHIILLFSVFKLLFIDKKKTDDILAKHLPRIISDVNTKITQSIKYWRKETEKHLTFSHN